VWPVILHVLRFSGNSPRGTWRCTEGPTSQLAAWP
jgi:hypothetical protein